MTLLDKFERWMELLGDAGDQLKNELVEDAVDRLAGTAVTLRPGVEIAAGAVKFVFDDMASAYAACLAELEAFANEHLPSEPLPAELEDIPPGEPDGIQPEDLLPF